MFLNLNVEPILETYYDPRENANCPPRSVVIRRAKKRTLAVDRPVSKFYPMLASGGVIAPPASHASIIDPPPPPPFLLIHRKNVAYVHFYVQPGCGCGLRVKIILRPPCNLT